MFKNKKGFTLAEATTVLIILGVIAALTIPTLIMRQKEVAERAKIKKAWEVYDSAIATMRADHPMMSKEAFTNWANQANCPNTVSYFKTIDVDTNNGCIFKTNDGIWFNISDILHPTITLDGNNNQNDDNTFTFVVSYDEGNLTFRVNDPSFPDLTNDEKTALKKLFSKLDEDVDIKETASKWVMNFKSVCYTGVGCDYFKYDYDSNGNEIVYYHECDSNGNNCNASYYNYDYDSNGNKIAYYWGCDSSGNNCTSSRKYGYDANGNMIAEYWGCNGDGNSCTSSRKFGYDSNGDKIAYYYGCNGSGNSCRYSAYYKYDYDSNGNHIVNYFGCNSRGNNCSYSYKYDYSNNGNTADEYECDGNGKNCTYSARLEYDNNGNEIAVYFDCDENGNNCAHSQSYEYDDNGNQTAYHFYCDSNGNNCEQIYTYSYTEIK